MTTRREFIASCALAGAALTTGGKTVAQAAAQQPESGSAGSPLVVSTWSFGQAANAAAWDVLEPSGTALDAVEQGARVPESDPANKTVGLGGLPDRDGHVTLDACIMDHAGQAGRVCPRGSRRCRPGPRCP